MSIVSQQIQCHGDNLTRVHEIVSPEILPQEYGGKLGPMTNEHIIDAALKRERMFRGTILPISF